MSKLYSINNTFESYQRLIGFYESHKALWFSDVNIGLHQFFAANMSAALGALLDLLAKQLNNIRFNAIDGPIEAILLKNDFLSHYGRRRSLDTNNTTIKFQKLKPTDGKYFKKYVIDELLGRNELPRMSHALKERIVEAIYEIFVNAQIHSETEHIYTCGQFFPNKNKIEFTIVDTGVGFRARINKRFNSELTAIQAITWAIEDSHTTKQGISGGIGLAILRELISMNKGKMQIVSNNGFYEFADGATASKSFDGEFPGTIVNLQFRTDDDNNYALKHEIDIGDIF